MDCKLYLLCFQILLVFITAPDLFGAPLSDSLYIEGYYTQDNKSVGRNKLENFLLDQNLQSAKYADKAKGMRLAAWAVGTPLWCVNTGIAIYEIKQLNDAIKQQNPAMINSGIGNITIPLIIGSDVTIFIQDFLRNRSDYALHKAVTAYNSNLAERFGPDSQMDRQITRLKSGDYVQDRVILAPSIILPVLEENYASRSLAEWSGVTDFMGSQAASIGSMFLFLAIMGYIDEQNMRSVNTHERSVQLGVGIGLTSFGIISEIISGAIKKTAIKRYNESLK